MTNALQSSYNNSFDKAFPLMPFPMFVLPSNFLHEAVYCNDSDFKLW
jgi:hypothetical protein